MFGFPKADRPQGGQFKRNLLKSVIFQVKFERAEDVVADFKARRETLKSRLPITNSILQNFAEVRFEKDKDLRKIKRPLFRQLAVQTMAMNLKQKIIIKR